MSGPFDDLSRSADEFSAARRDLPSTAQAPDDMTGDTLLGTLTLSPSAIVTQANPDNSSTDKDTGTKPSVCVDYCKHKKRTSKKAMVQCHLCQVWYHSDCVGEKDKDIVGLWSCPTCRQLPRVVQSLKNSMANMDTTIQLLQENNARLADYLNTQMKESKRLRDGNDALKEQLRCDRSDMQSATVQMLSDKISELTNTILRMHSSEVTTRPEKTLLIGGKSLRDVDNVLTMKNEPVVIQKKQTPTTFKDISCGFTDTEMIRDVNNIVIVCDSHDPSSDTPLEQISHEFDVMVAKAKSVASSVTVSSVPPVANKDQNEVVDKFNYWLKDKCSTSEVNYIDNNLNFVFRDGTCDPAMLLSDGIYLSKAGINRLMSNLSLTVGQQPCRPTPASRTSQSRKPKSKPNVSQRHNKPSSGSAAYRPKTGQCSMCGETNHISARCKHTNKVTCFTCGSQGHKGKHHGRADTV